MCLFACLCLRRIAAFWVPDFFNNNLANLDQLSCWFPFIMLVFIPTITMGIWAEERKQGTDELLLTIPAGDFDIVLGKYLAAVAIYTVALLFSLVCNYLVLNNLASTGGGLLGRIRPGPLPRHVPRLLADRAGHARHRHGGLVPHRQHHDRLHPGRAVELPLVFLSAADAILGMFGQQGTLAVKRWSIGEQFHDFGRGVISLAGLAYFTAIVVVMLYVSMVLIGRRHWFSACTVGARLSITRCGRSPWLWSPWESLSRLARTTCCGLTPAPRHQFAFAQNDRTNQRPESRSARADRCLH